MQKKANILDWFFIIPLLFMIAICVFVAMIIIHTVNDNGVFSTDDDAQFAIQTTENTILNFDSMFLFVLVGLSIFVIVSSAMVFNHPAMFFISVFLLTIAVTVAAVMSNTFWNFSNSNTIISTAASFPKITFIMERLPIYIAFMAIAGLVAMFVGYNRQ